jgi:CBS domain-containing protein
MKESVMTRSAHGGPSTALRAGAIAGLIGGIVLSAVMTGASLARGADVWLGAKLAGAPFLGERAMEPGFDLPAVAVGTLSHLGVSVAWGVLFGLVVRGLSTAATVAAGVGWGFVVWLAMYYVTLPVLGLGELAGSLPVGAAIFQHGLFGLSVAVAFVGLRPRTAGASVPRIEIQRADARGTVSESASAPGTGTPERARKEIGAMQVKDIMTPDPASCLPGTGLAEVAEMMVSEDCGEIPVCGDGRKPIGVITDRDIVCRAVAKRRNPLELRAEDCMSRRLVTATPETPVEECARLMEQYQVRRLPVVDANGLLCGMVSQADLARKGPRETTIEVVEKVSQPNAFASSVGGR